MPHSLVLSIIPKSPVPPQFLSGRHLHALFLNLVSSADPQLGTYLHDQKTEKAFTLSPLQVENLSKRSQSREHTLQWEHRHPIPPYTRCWWRISLLDDTLFGHLIQLWQNINPAHPWHLGPADLYITGLADTPQDNQPWANSCNYRQLYELASDCERHIAFSFCTPTTFRKGRYDASFPTRECVFFSLIHRWNKYSHLPISEEVVNFIFPSFFNIRTEVISDNRSKLIGCVGEVSYRILGEAPVDAVKQINALANFALYSGVGRKTTMGMGMVRRLNFT